MSATRASNWLPHSGHFHHAIRRPRGVTVAHASAELRSWSHQSTAARSASLNRSRFSGAGVPRAGEARGRRMAWWKCPECGNQFEARVADMSAGPKCPVCEPRRQAEWRVAYERYKTTAVAAVPELASAWDDEADPSAVMVAGDWELRRFTCPRGHHPRLSPLTYLQSGCPHCRGRRTTEERLAAIEIDPDTFELNREIAAQWHPTRNGN